MNRSTKYSLVLTVPLALLFLFNGQSAQEGKKAVRRNSDPALRLQGFEQHLEMKKSSPFAGLRWQFVGPTNISGRCTDVEVIAPKGKNYTIYVATASGGVWKTVNEGTTWEPIFDQAPATAIGDIAIAPANPDIVWVGTGEANIFRSSQAGCGIYKSLDGGNTWQHMGLSDTYTIPRIVIHPRNPDIVYVAASGHEWTRNAERGVYQTLDGGKSWQKILFVNDETGAIDLVMDPQNPATLYAAFWQRMRKKWNDPRNEPSYNGSGIYKSTDSGKTWQPINTGLPQAKYRGRIGIDIARSNPKVLYAFVDNYETARQPTPAELANPYGLPSCGFIKGATVYRSENGGEAWQQVSGQNLTMKRYMESHSGTYGWVFGQVRVDPNDENTVYTMGLELNVSRDGGKTFQELRGMHGDHHGLWIDPDNSRYLVNVNDGGIDVSYDGGKNWRLFTDSLPVAQFFNIACDMGTPFHVIGSIQDHGSYRGVIDLSRGRDKLRPLKFEPAPGGEGSSHAIDPTNQNIIYSASFYGTISRSDLANGLHKRLLPRTYENEPKLRGEWLAPFILSSHNPNIVYHGMQCLFRSLDRGDTWEKISPDLTYNNSAEMGDISYHTITAIAESPLKYGLLYVGTDDGRLHLSRDGGKTWQEIMTGLPYGKWISRVVASAYALGTLYLTQNGKRDDDFTPYVWKSTDYGKTWQSIAKGIPLGPVNVIREDPTNKNILYVGSDLGVYVSSDAGATWNVLGGNLPAAYVHDLAVQSRDNIIIIATHGRGVWALDANPVNKANERIFQWWEEED
jgi:photosystem II stability/assembly factor-like uncharacterized protein